MLPLTYSSSHKHKFSVHSHAQHSGLPVIKPRAGEAACGGAKTEMGGGRASGVVLTGTRQRAWKDRRASQPFRQQESQHEKAGGKMDRAGG